MEKKDCGCCGGSKKVSEESTVEFSKRPMAEQCVEFQKMNLDCMRMEELQHSCTP